MPSCARRPGFDLLPALHNRWHGCQAKHPVRDELRSVLPNRGYACRPPRDGAQSEDLASEGRESSLMIFKPGGGDAVQQNDLLL
jgi:hypothetical protein